VGVTFSDSDIRDLGSAIIFENNVFLWNLYMRRLKRVDLRYVCELYSLKFDFLCCVC